MVHSNVANSIIAAVGGGLSLVSPFEPAFSLLDLSISYPMVPESISTGIVALVCLAAPAVIIAAIVAVFVPGRSLTRNLKRREVIALKLWEFEKGWAGLALSIATAFFATQALKNMFGKPRPNCIATCQPDLSNIEKFVVGGLGQDISSKWVLVSSKICMNPDVSEVQRGFRSFPSGHASFSWSALLYLTLYLCSKFHISVPYLPFQLPQQTPGISQSDTHELLPLHHRRGVSSSEDPSKPADFPAAQPCNFVTAQPVRNQAASPPVHLLIFAFIPIAVAIYICSTRYVEYYHPGFDIICGSLIGILTAWLSFRWYHAPFGRGEGWAWGPRSRDRAFGVGVGIAGYVGPEGWTTARRSGQSAGVQSA